MAVLNVVKSIESMNQTKDKVCNQLPDWVIRQWATLAKQAGATHITIAIPYDSPECGDSLAYVRRWVTAARSVGLKIWWRQMFLNYEGIYDQPIIAHCNGRNQGHCKDYIAMMRAKIIAQRDLYKAGDVFSVTAEPASGRIRGINCFASICTFESASGDWNAIPEFNTFLLSSIQAAQQEFQRLSISVEINAGGLDGFVTIGYDNPDWGCDNGKPNILYSETVTRMGGFVFDHYFDPSPNSPEHNSMAHFLSAVAGCYPDSQYPNLKFQVGEWGPISGSNTPQQITRVFSQVRAAGSRFSSAFNYWQGGPAGQEALFAGSGDGVSLSTTPNYSALKAEYTR